jgi:hypothetical protein
MGNTTCSPFSPTPRNSVGLESYYYICIELIKYQWHSSVHSCEHNEFNVSIQIQGVHHNSMLAGVLWWACMCCWLIAILDLLVS